MTVKFEYAFAFPNAETFKIKPIKELVDRYVSESKRSVDPFARNSDTATYTNDLNPDTTAQYHHDALDFLTFLARIVAPVDLVLFDPPYSRRQVKEMYEGIGRHYSKADSCYHTSNWKEERKAIDDVLAVGGYVISFGWNSAGMLHLPNYERVEILLVRHGGSRNDTIVVVDRKVRDER